MISLGDVNFALGADTRDLQRSVQILRQFGREVDQAQTSATKSANQIAASFRRQEQATVGALNSTLRLASEMRKVEGGEKYARQATQAFQQLNATMTSGALSALQYQRAMERFRVSTANATRGFRDFATSTAHVNQLSGAMKGLHTSMILIQGPLGGVAARIATISSMMGQTGFAAAAFTAGFVGAGTAAYQFGAMILDAGKQVNQVMGQLTAVTGNTEQASIMFDRIGEIAVHSGQRIQNLATEFAKFTIAANGTGMTMAQVEDAFQTVASAATKLQFNQEQVQGVFKALEQMMSKATIQAEELRGQLGDRLPGAFSIMARALGVTTAQLGDMMKKGEVLAYEAIPKFIEELKKTYNIDSKPIDNYTAAVNNASTAWFNLRRELDKQIGVTDKVMGAYKSLTNALNWVRENLDKVENAARLTAVAVVGIATPAILSSMFSLGKAIVMLTARFTLLNTVLNKNPLIRVASFVAAIAGSIAALNTFGREIQVIEGELATFGDYIDIIWADIATSIESYIGNIPQYFDNAVKAINDVISQFGSGWEVNWENIREVAVISIDGIVDWFAKAGQELMIIATAFTNNILADISRIAGAVNSVRKWFAPWLDDPVGGQQSNKGFSWYDKYFKGLEDLKTVKWEEVQKQIDDIWNQPAGEGPGEKAVRDVEAYLEGLRKAANDAAQRRASIALSDKHLTMDRGSTSPFELDPGSGGLGGGSDRASSKALRELQRRLEAMKDISDQIERVNREIEALSDSKINMAELNAEFRREDEVERYAEALRKAGVATEYITQKTKELKEALEKRDEMKKMREAADQMRDSFIDAFDNVALAIFTAVEDGKLSFDSLKDVAIKAAMEILKTWWILAALNPLKNLLFPGQSFPTLGGGGGLASFKGNAFDRGYAVKLNAKGGVYGTPQSFSYQGGTGRMAEMGTEAIMPLGRDSHGNLGVKMVEGGHGRGSSVLKIELSPDLIAGLLQSAKDQSIEISRSTVKGFAGSQEFGARAIDAVRRGAAGRKI